jgi:two-component system sensor histidine kinase VicK
MRKKSTLTLFTLGILFWVLTAILDTLLIPDQSFFDWLIFRVPSNELNLRIATLIALALAVVALGKNSLAQESQINQMKKTIDKFTSLLNNLPVGIYRITPDGKILQCNRQFAETLGYEQPAELQNVNLNEIYTNKSDRQVYLEKLRKAPVFAEFELRRKDERTVWVREYPRATLNEDGTIDYVDGVCVETHGIDAIMRDIAEHKKLQSMRDNFIVAVTHELRTPLVSIKGYVDHIMAKEPTLPSPIKSQIEVVRRNTDRLLELTNDLLNIQDVESGKLEIRLEKLSLQETLTQCIEEIQPLLRGKKQEIKLEVTNKPLLVVGDRLRLNEVIMNLLSNANKFTPNGGNIIIGVEEDRTSATVHLTDNGIGIDKKDLDRVFDPFAVIEKPTYFKGTGLGLSLTKKLIEAQGGKIWVTSLGKGQGATFAFTLPKPKEEWIKVHG